MSEIETLKGSCLCGSVKIEATPENKSVGACHCNMCRRWAGGIYMVLDCGSAVKFLDDTDLGVYQSSDWGERGFCKKCGTSLFWKMRDKDQYMFSANAFDAPGDLIMDHEVFIDEKPDYYALAGDAKKMTGEEVFAYFAAENEDD